jgi:cobalt-zinc-cadmium efflux system outer membrane protein
MWLPPVQAPDVRSKTGIVGSPFGLAYSRRRVTTRYWTFLSASDTRMSTQFDRSSADGSSKVPKNLHAHASLVRTGSPGWLRRFGVTLSVQLLLFAVAWILCVREARAADVVPAATELPQLLSLDSALRIFRSRGLDLLIAQANTRGVEGIVKSAGAVPNPVVSGSVGNAFTYATTPYSKTNCLTSGASCSPWIYAVGITDSAAIEDSLSGKRELRLKVARNALAAAKMSRRDAERTIVFQVKSAYVQVALAALAYKFAKDMAASQATTQKKFQERYRGGAINEGDLQRIEVQKLEADQAVDSAEYALQSARLGLAFLLGVRGRTPEFDVDTKVLDFAVPASMAGATDVELLRGAFTHRPDLIGSGYLRQLADAQIELVRRQRLPDITLGVTYAWSGYGGVSTNGPIQGSTLTFGLSAPIPVFYGLEGELRQAEAQRDINGLQQAKTTAQVANEVSSAFAAFLTAKKIVERMEGTRRDAGGMLESAKGAFDIVAVQYEKGAAGITDYLDALRTYIATKNEYLVDLANYWTAVYQLEAAAAMDMR